MLLGLYFAAFFVLAEFALVQSRKTALESAIEAGEGNKRKLKRALKMVTNLNEYLSTTQVGLTITNIILGWIGADTLATVFYDGLRFMPIAEATLRAGTALVSIVLLTYVEVVATEIVPKNLSIDMPMKMLMFVVNPLHYFHICFYPFVWLLNVSATGIVKAMGLPPSGSEEDVYSQAEILNLSRDAVQGGELDKEDVIYMQRAFDFNDKVAKDIMVDRTSLSVVDITATVKDVLQLYLREGFSRYPVVADNDKDKILGYVYIYDIIHQAQVDDSIKIAKLLRTIITVPETVPVRKLLQQMIRRKTPILVVLDEYGGTSGIVTDDDIYEELFGPLREENDDAQSEDIIDNGDGSYKISGKTTLYDFERYFNAEDKVFEESESVTIAGYLLDNYSVKLGSVIELGGFKFKVIDFKRNYIDWLQVTPMKERPAKAVEQSTSETTTTE